PVRAPGFQRYGRARRRCLMPSSRLHRAQSQTPVRCLRAADVIHRSAPAPVVLRTRCVQRHSLACWYSERLFLSHHRAIHQICWPYYPLAVNNHRPYSNDTAIRDLEVEFLPPCPSFTPDNAAAPIALYLQSPLNTIGNWAKGRSRTKVHRLPSGFLELI